MIQHVYTKNSRSSAPSSASVRGMLWHALVKRKVMVFSLLFLLVTLPILYLVIKYQSPIQAAWYDDNYGYRQRVDITNAGTAQTDYQVEKNNSSSQGFTGRGFFKEGNVDKKKNHQKQTVQKNNIISQFAKINSNHSFFASSLRYLAIINEKIPEINFNVKTKKSPMVVTGLSLGSMKTTTNQAAAILINSSDSISNQTSEIIISLSV